MLEKPCKAVNYPKPIVSESEYEKIKAFIQGAVYAFSSNSSELFSVRTLFGGENRNWQGTPLQCIYDYYVAKGYDDPDDEAAKYVGKVLKTVLNNDSKWTYKKERAERTNWYKRVEKIA